MLIYKSNLALLNSRYGTYERRILEDFAEHPESNTVTLNSGIVILANYLIKDGVLEQTGGRMIGSSPDTEWLLEFSLTPKGRTIIESFALDIL